MKPPTDFRRVKAGSYVNDATGATIQRRLRVTDRDGKRSVQVDWVISIRGFGDWSKPTLRMARASATAVVASRLEGSA